MGVYVKIIFILNEFVDDFVEEGVEISKFKLVFDLEDLINVIMGNDIENNVGRVINVLCDVF